MNATNKWYLAYTYPQSEKYVNTMISRKGIETFLPMQQTIRQWSDRKKKVETPLFPNYIFVKSAPSDLYNLLQIRQLARFITVEGKFVEVDEKVIDSVKRLAIGGIPLTIEPDNPAINSKVKIKHGPFAGLEGLLERYSTKSKVIIRVEGWNQVISLEIDSHLIEKI